MEHPYKSFEGSETWTVVEQAIDDLCENTDIQLHTAREYVVGYIVKMIYDMENPQDD